MKTYVRQDLDIERARSQEAISNSNKENKRLRENVKDLCASNKLLRDQVTSLKDSLTANIALSAEMEFANKSVLGILSYHCRC